MKRWRGINPALPTEGFFAHSSAFTSASRTVLPNAFCGASSLLKQTCFKQTWADV